MPFFALFLLSQFYIYIFDLILVTLGGYSLRQGHSSSGGLSTSLEARHSALQTQLVKVTHQLLESSLQEVGAKMDAETMRQTCATLRKQVVEIQDERDKVQQRVDSLLADSQGHEELRRQNNSLVDELDLCRARLQEAEAPRKEAELDMARLREQTSTSKEGELKATEERDQTLSQLSA